MANINRINNIIESSLVGLNGLTSSIAGAQQIGQLNNLSPYYNDIEQLGAIGSGNYSSFDQINDEMNAGDFDRRYTYNDVRRMTGGQEALSLGTSTLSGATYGAAAGSIFGPVGTAIGTGIGTIAGFVPSYFSMKEAQRQAGIRRDTLNLQSQAAGQSAINNANAGYENLEDSNNRLKALRPMAKGGQMPKRQMTMKEFANVVLGSKNNSSHSVGIVRQHCDGGTMIRIKRR